MATEENATAASNRIIIKPRNVYGLRTDITGNIQFNNQQEVIYPVEGALAIHDFVNKKQRFTQFNTDVTILIMRINSSRNLLAILEEINKLSQISVYDVNTLKVYRTLNVPKYPNQGPVVDMTFTHDSKSILLLTKAPNEILFMLLLDVPNALYESRPTLSFQRGSVECLAPHPTESNKVAVAGQEILLLMSKSDKGFQITKNFKIDFHVTSMAYTNADLFWIGTSRNELIGIMNNEIKLRFRASTLEVIELYTQPDGLEKDNENRVPLNENLHNHRVTCLRAFSNGFAFAIYNRVFVFERVYHHKFERKTVLTIPVQLYADNLYQIMNLDIDHKQETVIVTARHSQIYIGVLIVPETLKTKYLDFEPLGSLLHVADILYVSICAWKPIIMTTSRDQTIRIWNYETETTELVRKYHTDVKIAELDPLGLFAAIAFTDQLRIVQIFMDDFNIVKTYNFPGCKCLAYSNWGHLLAAAYGTEISITSVFKLEVIMKLTVT